MFFIGGDGKILHIETAGHTLTPASPRGEAGRWCEEEVTAARETPGAIGAEESIHARGSRRPRSYE